MRKVQLLQKLQSVRTLTSWQSKLIESITDILKLKAKAQEEYKVSLQGINRQLQRYLQNNNGFLNDIIKSYQVYIQLLQQNQTSLSEGYKNEVLDSFKDLTIYEEANDLMARAKFFDERLNEGQNEIRLVKQLISSNEVEMRVLAAEYALGKRGKAISEDEKKIYAGKFADLETIKRINCQSLQSQVDGIMSITTQHDQLLIETEQYGSTIIQNRGKIVFDAFMRAFILETSYTKNVQYDVTTVLQRVKDSMETVRNVQMGKMKMYREKHQSKVKQYLFNKLKEFSKQAELKIDEEYIPQKIKDKWRRICEYFQQAI